MRVLYVTWLSVFSMGCAGKTTATDVPVPDFAPLEISGYADADAETSGCAQVCPEDRPFCDAARGICVECRDSKDCPKGVCMDSQCHEDLVCVPDEHSCEKNVAKVCAPDGKSFLKKESCGDKVCFNAECLVCIPGAVDCASATVAQLCKLDGSGWDYTDCGGLMCVGGVCKSCIPGLKRCEDTRVFQCQEDATTWAFVEDCDTEKTGKICHLGMCVQLCALNEKFKTNQGCEYWAIDMDNYHDLNPAMDGQSSPYAIVVSNTNAQFTATITISQADKVLKTVQAPPATATPIWLDPYNVVGGMKAKRAFHLKSTLPIVAYQFNPLENVGVYSNDASLLLPVNALGKSYMALAWPTEGTNEAGQMLASNVAIVAVEEGVTSVQVKPTADTIGGAGLPALKAGQTWKADLNQYEVVNLEAANPFTDLTGTVIDADRRIAVFAGHVCATAPLSRCVGGKCSHDPSLTCFSDESCPFIMACDHMEEELPPLAAWGNEYVVPRLWPRGKAPDVIRVLAASDNTHVTVKGASISIPVLQAGSYHEFEITQDIQVIADKPILIGQYMEGQDAPFAEHQSCGWTDFLDVIPCEEASAGSTCYCFDEYGQTTKQCKSDADCSPDDANIGDPSFILGVPTKQFRKEYVFLVPPKYSQNFVTIVAGPGTVVLLDDTPLDASKFTPVGDGSWTVMRMPLASGSHRLNGDRPVGLTVYGWDRYVSYGYPGGMNTETLHVD